MIGSFFACGALPDSGVGHGVVAVSILGLRDMPTYANIYNNMLYNIDYNIDYNVDYKFEYNTAVTFDTATVVL